MLDGVGYFDGVMEKDPEKILEFSDWMGIPLESRPVSLSRLHGLLTNEMDELGRKE